MSDPQPPVPAGRRNARRQAVFTLYQQDLLDLTPGAALLRSAEVEVGSYAHGLILGVAEQQGLIDALLREHLADWSLERLGILERAVLRVAVYELLTDTVPAAVVLDEAVELAKRFCSAEAGALVNGVLGSLVATRKKVASTSENEARKQA